MRSTSVYLEDKTEVSQQTRMLSEVVECVRIIISCPMLWGNNTTKPLVASLKVSAFKETGKYKTWGHTVFGDDLTTVMLKA